MGAASTFSGRSDATAGVAKLKPRPRQKKSRVGRALLFQMLISGSSPTARRNDVVAQSAVVYDEEPSVRAPLLNGVADDWSAERSNSDWDGREADSGAQNLSAIAGLLAVAGAGYFATRAVGTLFNHRTDLARIVPHPVAFSTAASESDSPRSSMSPEDRLRGRPLTPSVMSDVQMHDRGTSPLPYDRGIERSTSMGSLVQNVPMRDSAQSEIEDDGLSVTSAADAIDVASTASSLESSDMSSMDMRDVITSNRGLELPQFRPLTPDLVKQLPAEYTLGTMRERAQLAMKAAYAATEAAQRASAFSAAATTASATAAKASNQAMAAAALAHMALESGNIEQMTSAQAEAWKAVQIATEAENRAAEAAALATAYEDLSEQQSRVAGELSRPPPTSFLRSLTQSVSHFFSPITAAVMAVAQWFLDIWNYFASGTCWRQFCALCSNSVAFVGGLCMTVVHSIKAAVLYIFSKITGFCSSVGNGVKSGFDSCVRFFKVLCARIFHPKGSIGGDVTA